MNELQQQFAYHIEMENLRRHQTKQLFDEMYADLAKTVTPEKRRDYQNRMSIITDGWGLPPEKEEV